MSKNAAAIVIILFLAVMWIGEHRRDMARQCIDGRTFGVSGCVRAAIDWPWHSEEP